MGKSLQQYELRLLHLKLVALEIQRRGAPVVWGAQGGKLEGRGVEEGQREKSMRTTH